MNYNENIKRNFLKSTTVNKFKDSHKKLLHSFNRHIRRLETNVSV